MPTLQDHAIENQRQVEQMFAGAVFTAPGYALDECGWLDPGLLVDERIKRFWEAVKAGQPAADASLTCGLMPDIIGWMNDVTFLDVRHYANQIVKRAYLAQVGGALGRLAAGVQDGDIETVMSLIAGLEKGKPISPKALPTATTIDVEFAAAVEKPGRTFPSGIATLDVNTGGLERQTFSVLAARPSMGKSALAFQIARNVAQKLKVVFFSLEMSRISLWARAACPAAGVTWMDVKAGKLTAQQKRLLLDKSKELAELYGERLVVEDHPGHTTQTIWEIVATERPDLVLVDHLRFVKDKGDNEVKRQGLITERFHDMSKPFDCHVMALAQLNRGLESREDKRPQLSDLRDSGEIEENTDVVYTLFREGYYHPEKEVNPNLSETELWIKKFRDGTLNAMIPLMFDKRKQEFYQVTKKELNQ